MLHASSLRLLEVCQCRRVSLYHLNCLFSYIYLKIYKKDRISGCYSLLKNKIKRSECKSLHKRKTNKEICYQEHFVANAFKVFFLTHTKIGFLTFYEVYMIYGATVGACARGYICFIIID